MSDEGYEKLNQLLTVMFKAHPWHGVVAGDDAPETVTAYIEIVPTDTVKYEVDKVTGHLKVDRPQRYSSVCPTLYGFIPQTYCGELVAERCAKRHDREGIRGDGDPIDICVITEKALPHGDVLLRSRPIGGLRCIDGNEADDKIVAVLEGDFVFADIEDITDMPYGLLERLRHYFLSYKQLPSEPNRKLEIAEAYGAKEAREVIRRSMADYRNTFGAPEDRVKQLAQLLRGAER